MRGPPPVNHPSSENLFGNSEAAENDFALSDRAGLRAKEMILQLVGIVFASRSCFSSCRVSVTCQAATAG